MISFNIVNKNENSICNVKLAEKVGDISQYEFSCTFPEKIHPKEITVSFCMPYGDAFSIWNYSCAQNRVLLSDWRENLQKTKSRLAFGLPVHSVIAQNGDNVFTLSVSDIKNSLELSSGINEFYAGHNCVIKFFTQLTEKISEYKAIIRIDERKINFAQAITECIENLREINGLKQKKTPFEAKLPVFSTWYNFHQNINEENLLNQCRAASELGMKTIIIDDGWQTDNAVGGYAYCGDWKPYRGKFPNMAEFIKKVHQCGLLAMLWYSVPFVGKYSDAWKRFEGKFLDNPENDWCCLDPRFPDVRDYLVKIYEDALKTWKLDGFKLDFIDAFMLTEYSDTQSPERDFESLEEAVLCLLDEIEKSLKSIKPDVLIEFRQNYIGPAVTSHGNMIRVGDCAMDALTNRIGVLDLRLYSGKAAVHSDMIMWDYTAKPYIAAKQLCAILFGVPQISVLVDKISPEQYKMLKYYLEFYQSHIDTLIDGKLSLYNPEAGYSMADAETEKEKITVCYSKNIVELSYKPHYIVNGSGENYVVLMSEKPRNIRYEITDCMGEMIMNGENEVSGILYLEVPESGFLKVY